MAVWPGDNGVDISRDAAMQKGNHCNISTIRMGVHTGTHADAPFHFIDGGTKIDNVDLTNFIGLVKVFELASSKLVKVEDIKELPINKGDIVFFKTSNSLIPEGAVFNKEYIYLDIAAAEVLVERGIKTVGVDYLSVEGFNSEGHLVHKLLLSKNIGILEGLCLKEVEEGEYLFSALPLKIEDGDGSPVRAVLLEIDNT